MLNLNNTDSDNNDVSQKYWNKNKNLFTIFFVNRFRANNYEITCFDTSTDSSDVNVGQRKAGKYDTTGSVLTFIQLLVLVIFMDIE